MIIVGERINGTRERVRDAVLTRDAQHIAREAKRQADAGADYIDVNAGTPAEREAEDVAWLVQTVQGAVDKPVCIDSSGVAALRAGVEVCQGQALINSMSGESERQEPVLSLAREHGAQVVALTMDDSGLPKTTEKRIDIARGLAESARAAGIAQEDLFIDPLARAVGVENDQGVAFLDAVAGIKEALPEAHVICGLSNISFQMPARRLLNRTFLAMAMARGMDAAIVDPLDEKLMATVCAAKTLLGRDEMCLDYIQAYRAGRLEG